MKLLGIMLVGTAMLSFGNKTLNEDEVVENPVVETEDTTVEENNSSEYLEVVTEDDETFDFGVWMKETFNAETIATIISVITTIGVVLKLCATLKELAKKKSMTVEDVCNSVTNTLKSEVKEETEKMVKDLIEPVIEKVEKIAPVLNVFSKILALSQQNDAESKIAILKLIEELGNVGTDTIKVIVNDIEKQEIEKQEKKEEAIETLDEIISVNTSVKGRY